MSEESSAAVGQLVISTQLSDLIACKICNDKLIDAKMCPYCSKLCCRLCFKQWLFENLSKCPYCLNIITPEQLVTCRFLPEITKALESISSADLSEKCVNHNCPLHYYCTTCSVPICSDCAMFCSEHKNHEFQHLSSIYSQHIDKINNESRSLLKKISSFECLLVEYDKNIQRLHESKEEKKREIMLCVEQIQARLETQFDEKMKILQDGRKRAIEDMKTLKYFQSDLEQEIAQTSKSRLIKKSEALLLKLKDVNQNSPNKLSMPAVDYEIQSELVPKYDSGVFIVKNFSNVQMTTEVIYSNVLNSNGLLWRLKVYPSGNGVAKNNYLSVFVELLKGFGVSAKYDYRVEMVNRIDNTLGVIREFSSEFETGECWGYNKFFRLDLLKEEGYLGNNDTLVISFEVRAPSYMQVCKDQSNYINFLLAKEAAAHETIQTLLKKLKDYGELTEGQKSEESEAKEIFREVKRKSLNKASFMKGSEEEINESGIKPKNLDWKNVEDVPDFHSSDFGVKSIQSEEDGLNSKEYDLFSDNLLKAIDAMKACLN